MPHSKPIGWPKYMCAKLLRSGAVAYFWAPPSWAIRKGCVLRAEALGTDYGSAKSRCDCVLNPQLDAWRTRGASAHGLPPVGSFDWMVTLYKSAPRYTDRPAKTRKSYDAALALVSKYVLADGRAFGALSLKSILPGAADRLYAKLKLRPKGGERTRTAVICMKVCQVAWEVAKRDRPDIVPTLNPFAKMRLNYKAKPTRAGSHDQLLRFVASADANGDPSIGTAAMIAFYWLQREVDILSRLSWTQYRPADAPDTVRIFHHKTGEMVELPLVDDDGTNLWPELTARLDAAPRRGTLIITRDKLDRRRKVHLPWTEDYFRHRVAVIRAAAQLGSELKFMGLRHGGNTDGANAGLTDAQLRALSGHKTNAMVLLYAQQTVIQRRTGARKRLDARTKRGNLSE